MFHCCGALARLPIRGAVREPDGLYEDDDGRLGMTGAGARPEAMKSNFKFTLKPEVLSATSPTTPMRQLAARARRAFSTRVAIVGSGPSGFYAAKYLLAGDESVHVDVIDALPNPYGACAARARARGCAPLRITRR